MTLTGNVRIAVDIGGTFTDVQVLEESSGRSFSLKTPTTPHDPSQGLLTGIESASKLSGSQSRKFTRSCTVRPSRPTRCWSGNCHAEP